MNRHMLLRRIGYYGVIAGLGTGWHSGCFRRRIALLAMGLLLVPAALSPTHPVAVYGYLAATYVPALTRPVYAQERDGLSQFLISAAQVDRYRGELLADMADTRSGKFFVITRGPRGSLSHASVRTWNEFLPQHLPEFLRAWLDTKEFPYLADEVDLWLQGERIVATGHYHAFGGGPSRGDQMAQGWTKVPEVVVSNGVVPVVYLRGELLPYGRDVSVEPTLFRSLRTLDRSMTMGIGEAAIGLEPSPGMKSFLAYLRDYRGVDINLRQDVAKEIWRLCADFKVACRPYFKSGYTNSAYANNPDKVNVITNLAALQCWADIYEDAS